MAKNLICFLLVFAVLSAFFFVIPQQKVSALDYSLLESKLNTWQYYFCRTLMSIALKDQYDGGLLASVTLGQAIFEGGICGSPISVIGGNHFGIKAYYYFPGLIYDDVEQVTYQSYADFINLKGEEGLSSASLWRGYATWEEGVYDHSELIRSKSQYATALEGKTYVEVSQALQDAKYCGNSTTYASTIQKKIELYNLQQLDDVKKDKYGIFGLIMNQSRVNLNSGESIDLTATAYPETSYDYQSEIIWSSDNPSVATVDQSGHVTAVSHGYTLITADFGTKEAACVICVDTNAQVLYHSQIFYSQPDTSSSSLGKVVKGQPILVTDLSPIDSSDGAKFYAVRALTSSGKLLDGYLEAENVYVYTDPLLSVTTSSTSISIEPSESYVVPLSYHDLNQENVKISWKIGNDAVAEISDDGVITAKSNGVTVANLYLNGTPALGIVVSVGGVTAEKATMKSATYLRKSPVSEKGDNLYGTIRVDATIGIIANETSNWYRAIANINGVTMEGYVTSSYFLETGEVFENDNPNGLTENTGNTTQLPEVHDIIITDELDFPLGEISGNESLNVFADPDSSSTVLGILSEKSQVLVLDSSNSEWCQIAYSTDSTYTLGYILSDSLTVVSTQTISIEKSISTADNLFADQDFLFWIPEGETAGALADFFGEYTVILRNGSILSFDSSLQTGDEIRLSNDGIFFSTRKLVIKGDINGNGVVDAIDYLMLKRFVLGTYTIESAGIKAGNFSSENGPTAVDYLKLKRYVLGTYNL